MRLLSTLALPLLSLSAGIAAAASWSFDDAQLTVQGKGAGVGGGLKTKFSPKSPLSQDVSLGATDTLKIVLTTSEDSSPKRPHQAFLTVQEPKTGLEESFPFSIKESGKGKVELTHKDLPFQFLSADSPLTAKLTIASFGSSTPYDSKVFDLTVSRDPSTPLSIPEPPLRYGALPEIHHIFRDDPRSPMTVISSFFTLAVIATLPVLFGTWLLLGANVSHLGKAMSSAPISHGVFYGSLVALEGILFLYYTSWTLFQILPAMGLVGVVAFISGSRALSEVQERRLAGLR
ncbi:hypothetical protein M8818_007268 [Zalaria obscura]|uniref:Uncharacterized protein n=1 Tax=Zalaria obscura TaxID=2024903 RepID=A0ACC3S532_9PEZI